MTLCWMLPFNNCIGLQNSSEVKALLQSIFIFLSWKEKKKGRDMCVYVTAHFGVLESFTSEQCTN